MPSADRKISYNTNCPDMIAAAHMHRPPSPRKRLPTPSSSTIVDILDANDCFTLFFEIYVKTESAGWETTELKTPLNAPAINVTPRAVAGESLRKGHDRKNASQARSNARNLTDPNITCRVINAGSPAYNDFQPSVSSSLEITFSVPINPISL